MNITHLAAIARLDLSAEERENFAKDLSALMDNLEHVFRFERGDIEAMTHPLEARTGLRDDSEQVSPASREEMLSLAPRRSETCIIVPKILE